MSERIENFRKLPPAHIKGVMSLEEAIACPVFESSLLKMGAGHDQIEEIKNLIIRVGDKCNLYNVSGLRGVLANKDERIQELEGIVQLRQLFTDHQKEIVQRPRAPWECL